jgi:outer membrane receptor for ferrienterochelin and colicins
LNRPRLPLVIVLLAYRLAPGVLAMALAPTLTPSWARAAPQADEAQFRFLRGNNLYRQSRFDEALSEYYLSYRLVPNRNVEFNIARCLEKLRRFEEAFRAWSALDETGLPDAERATVREALDRLRPQLALVRVDSDPPGAEIYVNRRDLGTIGLTPKLIAVEEGRSVIILEREGHRAAELAVEIERGKELLASTKLERIFGAISFTGLPLRAQVRRGSASGEILRRGSGEVRLPPGRQVLVVTAPGFEPTRLDLEVVADATAVQPVVLRPMLTGSIVVRANIEGALVRVDGREAGFTPLVIEKVALGSRVVDAEKEGHLPQRAVVEVHETGPAYLDLRLRSEAPQISGPTKELIAAALAPASVVVITAEEIAAFGYLTLADALAGTRGVFASDDRVYRSLGIRGLSPMGDYTSRLLILVDGHPINDVLTGQGFVGRDFDVDLAQVERIEVARGPGAVVYGTGALLGVVNVVTRRPAPGVHAAAGVQGGTLGLRAGRVSASARGPGAEIYASAAAADEVGDRRYGWPEPGAATTAEALLSDQERARHVDVRARLGAVVLQGGWNTRDKEVPTGAFESAAAPGTRYRDRRAFLELRAERAYGQAMVSVRASYDESRFTGHYRLRPDSNGVPRDAPEDRFRARWLTGELRLDLPPVLRQRFTLGAEVQSQFELDLGAASAMAQAQGRADRELLLSAYAADQWVVSQQLRLNLGLRVDRQSQNFGTTINPRLAVIARPYARGNTKLLLGRAFRAPSVYERFYNDGGLTQVQAGVLEPEKALSAELEHAHALSSELGLATSLFFTEIEDLIVLRRASAGSAEVTYANESGRVRSVGAETELRWEPQPGTLFVAALTLARVRARDRAFPNAPQAMASVRWLYPLVPERLRLGSEVQLDSGRRTLEGRRLEDAVIWNVTLSGAYAPWQLRYFAGLFNLFDLRSWQTGFPVGPEVPSPTVRRYGRSARLGLQLAF